MPSTRGLVVVIATGGTIAGTAARSDDHVGYTAGALDANALIAAVPALAGRPLEAVSVARLDSADMDHATWQGLGAEVTRQLGRDEVCGVVVTHGTDTLEETAYFLHRVVAATKPVVLTAAMRPASAPSADGPQNLLDAVGVASAGGAGVSDAPRGVLVVVGGRVIGAADLRKVHGYRVDAFSAGDGGAIAIVEDGSLRRFRDWPSPAAASLDAALRGGVAQWPRVDIVTSHAGASGAVLDACVASGARGIVIAGTGNGTVHASIVAAARRAQAGGVRVIRTSRCLLGGVVGAPAGALPSAGALTPAQARVELLLELLLAGQPSPA